MINNHILELIPPILFYTGVCMVTACVGLVLQRCFCLNLQPSIHLITSIMMAVSTTFFYFILWLVLTILEPRENHFAPAIYALIITGLVPATILGVAAYKPNRQMKETKNELTKDNEIIND
jgi:hypothetical protein